MRYITYNDYVDCTNNNEFCKKMRVEEEITPYIKGLDRYSKEKMSIIKLVKNKQIIIKLLNNFFEMPRKLKITDLQFSYELREEKDNIILYKIKEKEMYIFIKLIDKNNYNFCYEIFESSMKIIKRWEEKRYRKDINYPIVIPIIIYIGEERSKLSNKDFRYVTYKNKNLNLLYNFINKKDFYKAINEN